jgi:Kef-type K+ transport system membrane component KefB
MKMAGYKFTRVELGLGCAVIYGIFFWICGACSQAIASTIQSPTWSNIIHSIGLAIVATMVFWIANRFFMYPLCGLLTGYNLVFKPPMKPEGKNNNDNICSTQNS